MFKKKFRIRNRSSSLNINLCHSVPCLSVFPSAALTWLINLQNKKTMQVPAIINSKGSLDIFSINGGELPRLAKDKKNDLHALYELFKRAFLWSVLKCFYIQNGIWYRENCLKKGFLGSFREGKMFRPLYSILYRFICNTKMKTYPFCFFQQFIVSVFQKTFFSSWQICFLLLLSCGLKQ